MTITDSPVDNGVNTAALLGARDRPDRRPGGGRLHLASDVPWVHGTHSTSTVDGLRRPRPGDEPPDQYRFEVDHPECFASQDLGATPVEYVLVGLAGCLTAGVAAVAQHRQIQLRSVTATIEGT